MRTDLVDWLKINMITDITYSKYTKILTIYYVEYFEVAHAQRGNNTYCTIAHREFTKEIKCKVTSRLRKI